MSSIQPINRARPAIVYSIYTRTLLSYHRSCLPEKLKLLAQTMETLYSCNQIAQRHCQYVSESFDFQYLV